MIDGLHLIVRGGGPDHTVTVNGGAPPDGSTLLLGGTLTDTAAGGTLPIAIEVDRGDAANHLRLDESDDDLGVTVAGDPTGWRLSNIASSSLDADQGDLCAGTLHRPGCELSLFGITTTETLPTTILVALVAARLIELGGQALARRLQAATEAEAAACSRAGRTPQPALRAQPQHPLSSDLDVVLWATIACADPATGDHHDHQPHRL